MIAQAWPATPSILMLIWRAAAMLHQWAFLLASAVAGLPTE